MKLQYEQALAGLVANNKQAVENAFLAWSGDASLERVRQNIFDETALSIADFAGLLNAFAGELASGKESAACWQTACHNHRFKGRNIPSDRCPVHLGRAKSLEQHADAIATASGGHLAPSRAKQMLLKRSGSLDVTIFGSFLYDAPLGRNDLVWATFDSADSRRNPFQQLPSSRLGIRTALGLGHLSDGESLILLCWNHAKAGSPPLHRPTVADAETSEYYRPCPDADGAWGLTLPLPPNSDRIKPQPEVVMPEPTSKGLWLPFQVI